MANLKLNGEWNEVKDKIKHIYSNLTENDLHYVEGEEDELLGRLQRKLGRTRDELRYFIERL
ncbi:MAG: CsbD family protein [Cyanobacteriota bacterium]|jgi:uncharacterized protein YjbJ (UPF0337 family)